MSHISFAQPREMPILRKGAVTHELCDGYIEIARLWDGRNNSVVIRPVRYTGPLALGLLRPIEIMGEQYRIPCADIYRIANGL